jgi:hypothetical protein
MASTTFSRPLHTLMASIGNPTASTGMQCHCFYNTFSAVIAILRASSCTFSAFSTIWKPILALKASTHYSLTAAISTASTSPNTTSTSTILLVLHTLMASPVQYSHGHCYNFYWHPLDFHGLSHGLSRVQLTLSCQLLQSHDLQLASSGPLQSTSHFTASVNTPVRLLKLSHGL